MELAEALPGLLDACAAIVADDAFEPVPGADITTETIEQVATSGALLPLGAAARMIRG